MQIPLANRIISAESLSFQNENLNDYKLHGKSQWASHSFNTFAKHSIRMSITPPPPKKKTKRIDHANIARELQSIDIGHFSTGGDTCFRFFSLSLTVLSGKVCGMRTGPKRRQNTWFSVVCGPFLVFFNVLLTFLHFSTPPSWNHVKPLKEASYGLGTCAWSVSKDFWVFHEKC